MSVSETTSRPITDRVRPYVDDIQSDAAAGDLDATNVVTFHRMHVACPRDPGALALCELAFEAWMKARAARKNAEASHG